MMDNLENISSYVKFGGLIVGIILGLGFFSRKTKKNLPPAPKGYPFIGNIILFKKDFPNQIFQLSKQYKGVYRLTFCGQHMIILSNYETIKKAFVTQGNIFSGRLQMLYTLEWMHQFKGIIFCDGPIWEEHRRFGLSTLRQFGLGKSIIENTILEETEFFLKFIGKKNGTSFSPSGLFNNPSANIILSMTCKTRVEYDDIKLSKMVKIIKDLVGVNRFSNPVNFFPLLRFVLPEFKKFAAGIYYIRDFLNGIIDDHIQHFDPQNINDYVDAYYNKMKTDEENGVKTSTFTRDQLIYSIEDLFLAGTETTSTTLHWAILFMLHFPVVQKKVQAEIDLVVGRGRLPSWSDKAKLPYTDATILEIQRMANLIPISVPHKTLEETELDGYTIPKGSVIIPDLTAIHFDPEYWTLPNNFEPTRFIDDEGNVQKNIKSFAPFSIGSRACLGENLAKMEIFIIFASLLQCYNLISPAGEQPPSYSNPMEALLLSPLPFNVCAIPR